MAITITGFLGYVQFYKNGAPVFRLPAFSATGDPLAGQTFDNDLSIYNAVYTPMSEIDAVSPDFIEYIPNSPPPDGTPSTSKTGGEGSITFFKFLFSMTDNAGIQFNLGSRIQNGAYPIVVKCQGYPYLGGQVYGNLVGGYTNFADCVSGIDVKVDVLDRPTPTIERLFVTSPSGDRPVGPAGGIEGNPIDQGVLFKANRGQSITFKFAMLMSDGSVDQNIETEISQPYIPGVTAGRDPHWFTVSNYNTVNIDPLTKYSLLSTYGTLRGESDPSIHKDYSVATINFLIQDPAPPYTDGEDGSSGVNSGTSTPSGNFPSDPGPSLVDKIPDGSAGNDIAQSGLYTKYLLNKSYMDLMGDILWEDNIVINALKELFGNPIDSIISCISYPFNLVNFVNRTNQDLFFGHIDTNIPFIAITKSSFQIDWGEVEIPFAWANFLDYSPYTKVELFLPWGPGYVTIDPNDIMPFSNIPGNFNVSTFTNGSIQVKTNIELDKGTCVHNVIGNNGRVIGSFSGVVGKNIALTALDTAGKAIATIGAVASIGAGSVIGGAAARGEFDTGRLTGRPVADPMRPYESKSYMDTGMLSGRSLGASLGSSGKNMASTAAFNTPLAYPRAGTFSDGSAAMTVQEPFLIISRPVQSVPSQYGHYNGYPSNIYYNNFSGIRGYTEISEIHLDNIGATTDELEELDAILKGGILL